MSKTLAAAAAFALALAPFAAQAANQGVAVQVSDLNLSRADGVETFKARVDKAADAFCGRRPNNAVDADCRQAILTEAFERLSRNQQEQVAAATGQAGQLMVSRSVRPQL